MIDSNNLSIEIYLPMSSTPNVFVEKKDKQLIFQAEENHNIVSVCALS